MKTTKEEKLIALATLVGLGRSVEILKEMERDSHRCTPIFRPTNAKGKPLPPPVLDWADMPKAPAKRQRKILRPSP
jgi:hypothetical protein